MKQQQVPMHELVDVVTFCEWPAARTARMMLESCGIEVFETPDIPGWRGNARSRFILYVRKAEAQAAREVLEELAGSDAKTEWMDTRVKIVDAANAAELLQPGILVVSGHFDPLLSAHAGQLQKLRDTAEALAVIITEPAEPILPARARAELVAALACVDLVIIDAPEAPRAELRLEQGHAEFSAAFVERVRKSQS